MLLIYVPCKNNAEAQKIARILLKEKLIACANIIPKINSVFFWDKKISECKETLLLMKTLKPFEKVKKRVEQLHSYKIPAIAALKINKINKKYFEWAKSVQEKR